MDKKRILFIIGFVIVAFLFGLAIYKLFFATEKPTYVSGPEIPIEMDDFPEIKEGSLDRITEREKNELPEINIRPGADKSNLEIQEGNYEKKFIEQKIVEALVIDPSPVKGEKLNFYNNQDGKFYQMLSDGTMVAMSDQIFYNVKKTTWSPNSDETILEYPDGSNIYYNFKTKKQATLPKHWEEFSFSPDGDKIVAKSIGSSPDNNWLVISDPDGKNIKLVESMGENSDKVQVNWSPNKQVIALSATGEALGFNQQEILLIGQNKENFKSITVEGRGLESKWSPEGTKLLHSVYNPKSEYKPELWIVDGSTENAGENRKPLGVNTWASKCAMADERYVYCAVPIEMEAGAGFAPTLSANTVDKLVKIDSVTGLKTEIDVDGYHVINKIFVNPEKTALFFAGQGEYGLFKINLK